MEIDLKQIRELVAVVSSTEVTELTIEHGDQRITIKKNQHPKQVVTTEIDAAPPAATLGNNSQSTSTSANKKEKAETTETQPSSNNYTQITSPMVGTFYRASSPTTKPFANVGDHIAVGQTVCIIEAMKLMNDMPSEVAGRIIKILVENGTTVEYGQPLFLVDPKG